MKPTYYLAECMDEKFHKDDAKTVYKLRQIEGVLDVFETYLHIEDKKYCIAVMSYSDKKEQEDIYRNIKRIEDIKSVKKFSEVQTPF